MVFCFPAHAETKFIQDPCAYNREVISGLSGPRFSYPAVWDAAYARPDRAVQLVSSIPMPGGTLFSVGRTLDPKDGRPLEWLFVELDRRGRPVFEKTLPLRGNELPVRMIETKDGVAVLSDLRRKDGSAGQARLAWFTKGGTLRHEKLFQDAAYAIEGTSIHAAGGKAGGVIVALHAAHRRNPLDDYAMIVRVGEAGNVLWRRTYRPGAGNMIMDIVPVQDGGFAAAGRIRADGGRGAGWVMRLGADGTILWQRTYARGGFSILRKIMPVADGFAVLGDARPASGGGSAAWLIAIDGNGSPQWQRFYKRDNASYTGAGLADGGAGRIALMMNAKDLKDGKDGDHLQLMSVSPRGALLRDEAYMRGKAARGSDFITGWSGERIVTASIDAGADAATSQAPRYRGWVLVATAPDSYTDPCRGR